MIFFGRFLLTVENESSLFLNQQSITTHKHLFFYLSYYVMSTSQKGKFFFIAHGKKEREKFN